jgi:hypothetical protein
VRQLAQRLGGHSGLAMVGTPATIGEEMEEWLMTEGSDGFTIQFPYLSGGLDDFIDRVVPELQRRGIFRRAYEGKTLRDNLELPRPKTRFFLIGDLVGTLTSGNALKRKCKVRSDIRLLRLHSPFPVPRKKFPDTYLEIPCSVA